MNILAKEFLQVLQGKIPHNWSCLSLLLEMTLERILQPPSTILETSVLIDDYVWAVDESINIRKFS